MEIRRQIRDRKANPQGKPASLRRTLAEGLLVAGALGLMAACSGPQEGKRAATGVPVKAAVLAPRGTEQESGEACGDVESSRRTAEQLVEAAKRLDPESEAPQPRHKAADQASQR
jgi:hypothetical protein